ncbi:hypothetical protein [Longimycelium tulufanense]|uniref:hypothetical protein n=1 Tax=Longimycelium tulufanense TaxID=907463 RepID=UPI001662E581|nr:hypothetical protein [Longimycelium tulufanense]
MSVHRPVRWLLVLLVLGAVGVGAAVAVWWRAAGPEAGSGAEHRLAATVVNPASCGSPNALDVVEVQIDGQARQATLDGCGHRKGEVLEVEVIGTPGAGRLRAQIAGTGTTDSGPALRNRLGVVLLTVAAVSGALLGLLVVRMPATRPTPARRRARGAGPRAASRPSGGGSASSSRSGSGSPAKRTRQRRPAPRQSPPVSERFVSEGRHASGEQKRHRMPEQQRGRNDGGPTGRRPPSIRRFPSTGNPPPTNGTPWPGTASPPARGGEPAWPTQPPARNEPSWPPAHGPDPPWPPGPPR